MDQMPQLSFQVPTLKLLHSGMAPLGLSLSSQGTTSRDGYKVLDHMERVQGVAGKMVVFQDLSELEFNGL